MDEIWRRGSPPVDDKNTSRTMKDIWSPSAEESTSNGSSSLFLNLLMEIRQLRDRVETLEKEKESRDGECSAWLEKMTAQATAKLGTRIEKLEEEKENCDAQKKAWMEKHCTSAEFVALIDECVSHCTALVSLKGSVGLLTTMLSSVDREVNALKTDVTKCNRQTVNLHAATSEQNTMEEELTGG